MGLLTFCYVLTKTSHILVLHVETWTTGSVGAYGIKGRPPSFKCSNHCTLDFRLETIVNVNELYMYHNLFHLAVVISKDLHAAPSHLLVVPAQNLERPSHEYVLTSLVAWPDLNHKMGLDARKPVFGVCEQHRRRPACASAQPDQCLCYSLIEKYHI